MVIAVKSKRNYRNPDKYLKRSLDMNKIRTKVFQQLGTSPRRWTNNQALIDAKIMNMQKRSTNSSKILFM